MVVYLCVCRKTCRKTLLGILVVGNRRKMGRADMMICSVGLLCQFPEAETAVLPAGPSGSKISDELPPLSSVMGGANNSMCSATATNMAVCSPVPMDTDTGDAPVIGVRKRPHEESTRVIPLSLEDPTHLSETARKDLSASKQAPAPAAQPDYQLLCDLQKLFALMAKTRRTSIDNSAVLRAVVGDKSGQQQDISEFNDVFLEKLSAACEGEGTPWPLLHVARSWILWRLLTEDSFKVVRHTKQHWIFVID